MDDSEKEVLSEIREIISGLKVQADMTQSMRMTVPLSIINDLFDLWVIYEYGTP